jgi:hypothetical protein
MGDTHYLNPEYHRAAFNEYPPKKNLADLRRHEAMTRDLLPEVITEIAAMKPDFIVQTGDIIQGHCDDLQGGLQEMEEALDLFKGLKAPLFFALGTHDGTVGKPGGEPVQQLVYPAIGKLLEERLERGYYSFEKEGCLFIVFDYTTFKKGDEQSQFIKESLSKAKQVEHVFVFAHPPLIPVGRPFFSDYDFADTILQELSLHPIDAYFCGHTHHQTASLHKVGQHWLPHLKSTVLGYPEDTPIPVTDVRPLLPDPEAFELGWSFFEDSMPGWWLITVEGEQVVTDWYVLRQGRAGQLTWRRGEKACFTQKPPSHSCSSLPLPKMESIRSVNLRVTAENCISTETYRIFLNDRFIGYLPKITHFNSRILMPIGLEYWPDFQQENKIKITTTGASVCIGAFVLEIESDSGMIRSDVSPYFTNTSRWDRWGSRHVHRISEGEDISFNLCFQSND